MNFKKWVKSIQTGGYVRACTVSGRTKSVNKQQTQIVIELNSSLGQLLGSQVTFTLSDEGESCKFDPFSDLMGKFVGLLIIGLLSGC